MTQWKESKLGDVCTKIEYGYTESANLAPVGPKFLRITDIVPPMINWETVPYCQISDDNAQKYKLEIGDIVIARTGATTGYNKTIKQDVDAVFASYLIRYRINKKIADPFYIGYTLQSSSWFEYVNAIIGGSAQPGANARQFAGFEFLLPPPSEQRRIAGILSVLDEKIELLHSQNANLEALAQTYFRQWFVEDAGKDWEEGTLGEEFEIIMGQSPPGTSYNENGIGIPMFQGNADFSFRFPEERVYTTDPKRFAEKYDTLISVRAPVGAQNMAKSRCCIGRGVAAFRYKRNTNYYTYTYYKLASLMDEIKKYNDEGTVFGAISKSDFESLSIMIPPDEQIVFFESHVSNINKKIIANASQIRTLCSYRDLLLPKLMSGEVRVKE